LDAGLTFVRVQTGRSRERFWIRQAEVSRAFWEASGIQRSRVSLRRLTDRHRGPFALLRPKSSSSGELASMAAWWSACRFGRVDSPSGVRYAS